MTEQKKDWVEPKLENVDDAEIASGINPITDGGDSPTS